MNIKTNLNEEYVNFVETTKKQNKILWIFTNTIAFIVIILSIIWIFRYLNE